MVLWSGAMGDILIWYQAPFWVHGRRSYGTYPRTRVASLPERLSEQCLRFNDGMLGYFAA